MEMRPYYDRPVATIDAYVTEIISAVASNFKHWGDYKYVWPKQGYGKGVLRADQFSILGTFGQWLVPSSGSSGNPNTVTVDSFGWAQRVLDFKTLEEFYYLIMGVQYPVSPLLITEHQWRISGVETPVIDQQLFEVLEEPFCWYEMPVIVEPEKTIVCAHRVVGGLANYGNSTSRALRNGASSGPSSVSTTSSSSSVRALGSSAEALRVLKGDSTEVT